MTIYTIGYEKRNIQDYIEMLKGAKVETLIDVRETAWSYKTDFCKTKLSKGLADAGIAYVHMRELGNPKKFRQTQSSSGTVLKKYKSYLNQTQSGLATLQNIILISSFLKENICLTCFERDHRSCHRSIITEQISKWHKREITHL